jgi:hypothetical protein
MRASTGAELTLIVPDVDGESDAALDSVLGVLLWKQSEVF